MYALALTPLINALPTDVQQIWFADDAGSGGTLSNLKQWWDSLLDKGPQFGYYSNPEKTHLLVKTSHLEEARAVFKKDGINITDEGRKYLGAPIGSKEY